jgi:predicted CXXCH cytochrome family protein
MRTRGLPIALAAASFLLGCSTPRGHRVLTFFFDGVPPLAAPAPVASHAPAVTATSVRRAGEHGPFVARLCDACHEPGRGNALVAPKDQLCLKCHAIDLTRRYVHGPLLAGDCGVCHDPHRSAYPSLLVAESRTFCVRCHDRASLRSVEGHDGSRTCVSCHDAHGADRPVLLKAEEPR